jgi:hypothetical protein
MILLIFDNVKKLARGLLTGNCPQLETAAGGAGNKNGRRPRT